MFNKSIFKVATVSVLFFLTSFSYAQNNEEVIQRFLEQRRKMMEEIMKSFNDDDVFKSLDKDFFGDDFFEEFKKNGFEGLKGLRHSGSLVSIEEKINKDGNIEIFIKPQNKNIKLDIETTDNEIIIKGESIISEENKSNNSNSRSMFKSTFTRSINIPTGHKALPAESIDDGLKITLVQKDKNFFKKKGENKKLDKTPIGKTPGQETI